MPISCISARYSSFQILRQVHFWPIKTAYLLPAPNVRGYSGPGVNGLGQRLDGAGILVPHVHIHNESMPGTIKGMISNRTPIIPHSGILRQLKAKRQGSKVVGNTPANIGCQTLMKDFLLAEIMPHKKKHITQKKQKYWPVWVNITRQTDAQPSRRRGYKHDRQNQRPKPFATY